MNRQDFLKVYHQVKGDIEQRENNQFADVTGDLVSVEVHDKFSYDEVDGVLTTESFNGDDIGEFDLLFETLPTQFSDCLMVVYYRKNHATTRLDFYNNTVEVAPYDLLESWQTLHYKVDSKGVAREITVYEWNV